jgi:hypothetical protein
VLRYSLVGTPMNGIPIGYENYFDVGMVKAICQIPIGSMTSSDVPIWNATTYKWRGHC